MLINLKLLLIANSFLLNMAKHEKFFANKYENAYYYLHFFIFVSSENLMLSRVEYEQSVIL